MSFNFFVFFTQNDSKFLVWSPTSSILSTSRFLYYIKLLPVPTPILPCNPAFSPAVCWTTPCCRGIWRLSGPPSTALLPCSRLDALSGQCSDWPTAAPHWPYKGVVAPALLSRTPLKLGVLIENWFAIGQDPFFKQFSYSEMFSLWRCFLHTTHLCTSAF